MLPTEVIPTMLSIAFLAVWVMAGDIVTTVIKAFSALRCQANHEAPKPLLPHYSRVI